jgi:hypothetical protein
MRRNIRCLLLGTSRLDSNERWKSAGAGELAGCRHIYILSYQTGKPYAGRSASYRQRSICSALSALTFKPRPPPFLPHAPSQPLCIRKAAIWTRHSSVGAQGFPSAFLWQRRPGGTTADSRSTSKPPFQRRYQALPTVVTRHRRFCGYISSIADGGLAAIRAHSCMSDRTCRTHHLTHL